MWRLVWFCLASVLSLAGGSISVHAYESRIDRDVARHTEITFAFSPKALETLKLRTGPVVVGNSVLPREYASAMTWYRVALTDGYMQPPIVTSSWPYDEQLPEPLHWTWVSANGDLITRTGKGVFRLSFADNRSNWYRDMDCRLQAWPGGDTEAPMLCNDGSERKMRIPGDGVVFLDEVEYRRVFTSEVTTLPPEEEIDIDQMTAAAIEAANSAPVDGASLSVMAPNAAAAAAATAPAAATVALPDQAPIPPAR